MSQLTHWIEKETHTGKGAVEAAVNETVAVIAPETTPFLTAVEHQAAQAVTQPAVAGALSPAVIGGYAFSEVQQAGVNLLGHAIDGLAGLALKYPLLDKLAELGDPGRTDLQIRADLDSKLTIVAKNIITAGLAALEADLAAPAASTTPAAVASTNGAAAPPPTPAPTAVTTTQETTAA